MTITLRPEQERRIAAAVRSGAYQSADEVIDRALEMLQEQEEWLIENRTAITQQIEGGYVAAQRSELIDGDQVRAEMEVKKRTWLDEHRRE